MNWVVNCACCIDKGTIPGVPMDATTPRARRYISCQTILSVWKTEIIGAKLCCTRQERKVKLTDATVGGEKMPPARSGDHIGRQRGMPANSKSKDGRSTTGSIWDLVSSLRVANDEFQDLLVQDRPPLPLLPDIMGMAEMPSPSSKWPAADTGSIPVQRDTVMSDLPTSEPYLQDIDAYYTHPMAEQHNSQTISNNLFGSFSNHHAPFDFTGLPDHYTEPSIVEQPEGGYEEHLSGILGMAETSPPSTRRAIGSVNAHRTVGIASHQDTVESTGSREIQHNNSDQLDSLMSESPLSPEEQGSSVSNLYSDYQDLFDSFGVSDSYTDPSLVEQPQGDIGIEDRDEWDKSRTLETLPDTTTSDVNTDKAVDTTTRCWDHGCNGRQFSTRSNLLRHQIEKGKARPNFKCPTCGAFFSRTTARNQHVAKKSCNRVRRYSNGRERPGPRVIDEG